MKYRNWTPEAKLAVVLEGLRGRPVGDICADHGVSQSQYYRWRDQFFDGAHRAFVTTEKDSRAGQLERENARLKALVAELALEVKKNSGPFG
jgi:transposase-like protein